MDRRGSKNVLGVLVATMVALCIPATAHAAGEEDTGGYGAFRLEGTNGYGVLVLAISKPHFKHGEVLIVASGRSSAVTYFAPATVTATTIEADLGAIGTISVAFEPEGDPERVRPHCDAEGGSTPVQPGSWVGTVDLAGEEGFTRAEATRLKSIVSPFLDLVCPGGSIGETVGQGIRGARLVARKATNKRTLFMQVNQNRPGGRVRVEASIEERRKELVVSRELVRRYSGTTFDFDPQLRSAAFKPQSPFSGYAAFRHNAKPWKELTGNLTLDFPGRANVPMAGPGFEATLRHATRTEEQAD